MTRCERHNSQLLLPADISTNVQAYYPPKIEQKTFDMRTTDTVWLTVALLELRELISVSLTE